MILYFRILGKFLAIFIANYERLHAHVAFHNNHILYFLQFIFRFGTSIIRAILLCRYSDSYNCNLPRSRQGFHYFMLIYVICTIKDHCFPAL